MTGKREPCPVCGGQPEFFGASERHFCDHGDRLGKGEVSGPLHDPDGVKWDGMCRAIRARALADVRAKVEGLGRYGYYTGSGYYTGYGAYIDTVKRAAVLALLDAGNTP